MNTGTVVDAGKNPSGVDLDVVRFIRRSYENAHHPLFSSRQREFDAVRGYAQAYGVAVSEVEFDHAIAEQFGGGVEFEWPNE